MAKLSNKTIKDLAKFLDDLTTFHGFLEAVDGTVYRIILNILNNKFGGEIPDNLNALIDNMLTAIENGNWELAEKEMADFLAGIIDTPWIDGTKEEIQVYETFMEELGKLIQRFFASKK